MGSTQSAANNRDVAFVDEVAEAAQFATVGGMESSELTSRVQLSVSCSELRRRLNAMAVVYLKEAKEERWSEVGQTEVVSNSFAPAFVRSVVVRFTFEVQQQVRVELHHLPRLGSGNELVGFTECFLAEIVTGHHGQLCRTIETVDGASLGQMFIAAEEVGRHQNLITMNLRAEQLPVMDFFTRACDPYLILSRTNPALEPDEPGYRAPVYRGEVVKRNRTPHWEPVVVTEQQICGGDDKRLIDIEVFDWDFGGKHELIGKASTTLKDIQKCAAKKKRLSFQLMAENPEAGATTAAATVSSSTAAGTRKKKKGKKYIMRGKLHIDNVLLQRQYTFLDYVLGGLEMALIVAIDFSRSNGDPAFPESLHYFNTDEPNDYVMAMKAVGEIHQHYDTDKQYPIYGFGARMPPTYALGSDCFSVKGDYFDPEVAGVQGLYDAYRDCLQVVRLHGPTSLAPVVNLAGQWATTAEEENKSEANKYFILLIITDGEITDLQKTIDAVVKCSKLPLSIVIVGVGQSDFRDLKILDSDDKPLFSQETQTYMERDIVQFVPFDEFKDRNHHDLALATLEEVPRELVGYFRKRNIAPKSEKEAEKEKEAIFVNQFRKKPAEKIPKFLIEERDRLIKAVAVQGYNTEDVARAIDAGIPSPDPLHVIEVLAHHAAKLNSRNRTGAKTTVSKWRMKPVFANALEALEEQKPVSISAPTPGRSICSLCQSRPVSVKFVPCGHSVTCAECSKDLGVLCPLCRTTIERIASC